MEKWTYLNEMDFIAAGLKEIKLSTASNLLQSYIYLIVCHYNKKTVKYIILPNSILTSAASIKYHANVMQLWKCWKITSEQI